MIPFKVQYPLPIYSTVAVSPGVHIRANKQSFGRETVSVANIMNTI